MNSAINNLIDIGKHVTHAFSIEYQKYKIMTQNKKDFILCQGGND